MRQVLLNELPDNISVFHIQPICGIVVLELTANPIIYIVVGIDEYPPDAELFQKPVSMEYHFMKG